MPIWKLFFPYFYQEVSIRLIIIPVDEISISKCKFLFAFYILGENIYNKTKQILELLFLLKEKFFSTRLPDFIFPLTDGNHLYKKFLCCYILFLYWMLYTDFLLRNMRINLCFYPTLFILPACYFGYVITLVKSLFNIYILMWT